VYVQNLTPPKAAEQKGKPYPGSVMAKHHLERVIKVPMLQCYTVAIDRHRQSVISSNFALWLCPGRLRFDACSGLRAKYLSIGLPLRGARGDAGFLAMEARAEPAPRRPSALFGVKADMPPCGS
jgi:hypothetical protein